MAFDLNVLAQELGIDPATLSSKPEVVSKWNGYLAEADTKYTQGTAAQRDAEVKLQAIQDENATINAQIEKFGLSDAANSALRANYAAMEAQLKNLKEAGFADIKLPDSLPTGTTSTAPAFDPIKFSQDVNQSLVLGFDMNNRYQRLYGQPMPDDLSVLLREAQQARKPLTEYVPQKYDFSGQEKKLSDDRAAKHDAEVRAAAVKEYQEKHPVTAGNHELQGGRPSMYSQMPRRESPDQKGFANLTARQKISMSVGKTRQALESAN